MNEERCIRVRGVERSFGDLHVLRGVDLDVRGGELVALFGPSGSGKTTLLNLIGALDRPDAGQIEVLGRDIVPLGERRRARLRRTQIGFIFQGASLLPTYSARENIDLALRLPGLGYFERRRRTRAALEAVGLSAWADHLPEEMSGGQRQRIAIARALALQPRLVLADEPTSGIDTAATRRVLTLFRGLAQAEGITFVLVSHDPLVVDFVDTVYDLLDGQLVQRSTAGPEAEPQPAAGDTIWAASLSD
ncbi:MAG: ABC transporter ATP-binding protein [Chloroflexi bacterium]|nr:ABC transporter ATP-binding protein [Chloroflexota bacterium]